MRIFIKSLLTAILIHALEINARPMGDPDDLFSEKPTPVLVRMSDANFPEYLANYKAKLPEMAAGKPLEFLMAFSQASMGKVRAGKYKPGFEEFERQLEKRVKAIKPGEKLTFFFKGFPFKSRNSLRSGGEALPGGAELLALTTLNHMVEQLKANDISAGFLILSDGLPYKIDGIDPEDDKIAAYHDQLKAMISGNGLSETIKFETGLSTGIYRGLEKYFEGGVVPREMTPGKFREIVALREVPEPKELDGGLKAFFSYDIKELDISRKIKVDTVVREYQNSNAKFARFLEEHLKDHGEFIHFSVHDYGDFKKFPLRLYRSGARFVCPWQGVLGAIGGELVVAKHSETTKTA